MGEQLWFWTRLCLNGLSALHGSRNSPWYVDKLRKLKDNYKTPTALAKNNKKERWQNKSYDCYWSLPHDNERSSNYSSVINVSANSCPAVPFCVIQSFLQRNKIGIYLQGYCEEYVAQLTDKATHICATLDSSLRAEPVNVMRVVTWLSWGRGGEFNPVECEEVDRATASLASFVLDLYLPPPRLVKGAWETTRGQVWVMINFSLGEVVVPPALEVMVCSFLSYYCKLRTTVLVLGYCTCTWLLTDLWLFTIYLEHRIIGL